MSNEMKTDVIVTKYALSEGPFKVSAELSFGGTMASYRIGNSYTQTAHGKDFWLTEEEALADCERRRQHQHPQNLGG
ncbi:hypothetical protein [Enterobacter sp.]|uniref:hypothetical protein n=1 Tax=Enterobacter sp. TaxID=42895 RepID=UPI00296E82C8|nr:hypothetical protein [Enterobacter sp.]